MLRFILFCWEDVSVKEGLGKMKVVVCLGMAFALSGCVTAQEQTAVAVAQCRGEPTPVEWVRCLNAPETRSVGKVPVIAYSRRE